MLARVGGKRRDVVWCGVGGNYGGGGCCCVCYRGMGAGAPAPIPL